MFGAKLIRLILFSLGQIYCPPQRGQIYPMFPQPQSIICIIFVTPPPPSDIKYKPPDPLAVNFYN